MILLLLMVGETLRLVDGRVVVCDNFKRDEAVVLIKSGEQLYTLPAELVDWERTQREKTEASMAKAAPAPPEKKRQRPKYRGFVIQKLDVTRTSLVDLLRFMADMVGINLYVDSSVVDRQVTYLFKNVPWDQALTIILFDAGLDYRIDARMLHVRG